MDLGKLLNNSLKNNNGGLKQILILGALAVIVMGFGNGLPMINGGYNEQYSIEPDNEIEKQRPKHESKKKHKHHHRSKPEYTNTDTAAVENEDTASGNNTEPEETLNPSYATYTVE